MEVTQAQRVVLKRESVVLGLKSHGGEKGGGE